MRKGTVAVCRRSARIHLHKKTLNAFGEDSRSSRTEYLRAMPRRAPRVHLFSAAPLFRVLATDFDCSLLLRKKKPVQALCLHWPNLVLDRAISPQLRSAAGQNCAAVCFSVHFHAAVRDSREARRYVRDISHEQTSNRQSVPGQRRPIEQMFVTPVGVLRGKTSCARSFNISR
jgi:hypothetical protein